MSRCPACDKEFESANVSILDLCDNCLFEQVFKNSELVRQRLEEDLLELSEMCIENNDVDECTRSLLIDISERLKGYSSVVGRL